MGSSKEKKQFFTPEEEEILVKAIEYAEKQTSGEVRIRIEQNSGGDSYKRAVHAFEKLGMTQTAERNGILFYLSIEDKQFALIGDQGIHEKVGASFWDEIKDTVLSQFKKGEFTQGLIDGISQCGIALSKHFPYQKNDIDELSNEISQGEL